MGILDTVEKLNNEPLKTASKRKNCLVSSDINDFLDNLDRKRENRKKFAERFTRTRVDLKEDD